MTLHRSFLKKAALFGLLFLLAGFSAPPLVPKAHALYWEDDYDGNDPKERKRRPEHFSLFDWSKDADKDTKARQYRDLESMDHGPAVNNDARTLEIISSGVIGLALGLVTADKLTTDSSQLMANLFIGGSLGFGFGVGFGALIMPNNYDVDPIAQTGFPAQRQASLKGLDSSLRTPELLVSFKF